MSGTMKKLNTILVFGVLLFTSHLIAANGKLATYDESLLKCDGENGYIFELYAPYHLYNLPLGISKRVGSAITSEGWTGNGYAHSTALFREVVFSIEIKKNKDKKYTYTISTDIFPNPESYSDAPQQEIRATFNVDTGVQTTNKLPLTPLETDAQVKYYSRAGGEEISVHCRSFFRQDFSNFDWMTR